jgi:hypothetical protein
MSNKIGRNDPCPCGSGKKYKNCCADLAEVIELGSDPWMKANQLMTETKMKLEAFYSSPIKKARRDAAYFFLRYNVDQTNIPPDYEAIFSDWLWFDYRFQDGKTLGQNYTEASVVLPSVLKDILQSLNESYLSIYCVKESQDNLLLITDLFSGRDYEILLKEPWDTEITPRIFLLGRIVTVMGYNIFSGMVLVLQASEDQELFLRRHVEHWQELNKKPFPQLFKDRGEIILGFFDHAYQKNLIRLQELYKFPVTDQVKEPLLAGILSADYQLAFHAEGFDWYKPAEDKNQYRRIAIGQDTVLFSADFLEDLDEMEQMIQDAIGKVEKQMVHSKLADTVSPDDLRLWFLILMDLETERWLYAPLVDLDGLTPDQVLSEPGGKDRILALLESFISQAIADEFKEMENILGYIKDRIQQMPAL